ncbi:DUF3667 domain-containing protein [Zunongwangia sp. HGR-M22]|uniref:DUF3667 domain-containing protein n=1 Tax=Zunongwangia sp. HGR-M22 TaxID=3015168 RepID=UPI0022DE1CD7|nr:DUF3667 domain-containing protein [Zunongwangia sp. HGR-M22]WBL27337.1 DUF3667 domain-containing protein [Zunongwangia sp. HGR-M22]
MAESCLNCGWLVDGNYCGNCGQKKFNRIDRRYVLNELESSILQTNKGFLYSIKRIIRNPGRTAKEFIDGNRINHYKPILLAFLLCGISAFISFQILGLLEIMKSLYLEQEMLSGFMNDYLTISSRYNSVMMLLLVPFYALVTKLAFRKWGHNYCEHIVMNSYILSLYLIMNIVIIYPLIYIFKNSKDLVIQIPSLSMLALPIIMLWFFRGFYDKKPFKSIFGRVLLTVIYTIIGLLILLLIGIIIGIIAVMIKGPEVLKYFGTQ